ncbi:MAG: PDDEXK nuclease domain-containing protein [Bacteroidota bacterium]
MNVHQQVHQLYQNHLDPQWQYVPFYKVECFWKIGACLGEVFVEVKNERERLKQHLITWYRGEPAKERPSIPELLLFVQFYFAFPTLEELSALLSWSHYQLLLKISDADCRKYYFREAVSERWTVNALQTAIKNRQYHRVQPQNQSPKNLRAVAAKTYFQFSFLKKFSGQKIPERQLESALVQQLQDFLNELGKGFAFVARQKRLLTPNGKQLFVDLLFYNYILHRFVLIDLKIVPLTYEHIGQMDTYCRLFNETTPLPDRPPCLGIILCPKVDTSFLHYSLLKDHPTLFAFEYTLHSLDATMHQKRTDQQHWEHQLFQKQ